VGRGREGMGKKRKAGGEPGEGKKGGKGRKGDKSPAWPSQDLDRDNLLRWCESFLVGRFQSVLVDGVKSTEESILSGVPHCSGASNVLVIYQRSAISHEC